MAKEEKAMATDANEQMVKWDDSNTNTSYVNVCNASITREELTLLFGVSHARQAGQKEQTVKLSTQIILSPIIAKQIAIILNKVILDHESRYGSIVLKPQPSTRLNKTAFSGLPFPQTEKTAEKSDLLFQLMGNISLECSFERSFKMTEKTMLGNRFLLGIKSKRIQDEKLLDTCQQMGMSEDYLESFKENLSDADYVHFGFEENEKSCLYKTYLEFWDKYEARNKDQPDKSDPFLLHLGFKWDVLDNSKCALSRYTWYPHASIEDILARLSNILNPGQYGRPFEIVKNIVEMASRRIPHYDIFYLEVTEDNNTRKSFDINMYRADFRMEELFPILMEMVQYYSISIEKFHTIYDQVENKTFGHISGGIDRDGKDFLTIYFGVEKIHGYGNKPGRLAEEVPHAVKPIRSIYDYKKALLSEVKETDEKAGIMIQLVNNLDIRYGFERSFKFLEKNLLTNRFLLGFRKNAIIRKPDEKILDICKQIDMPESFLEVFQENLSEANIVLFGFEEDENACVCKAYLEFTDRLINSNRSNSDKPDPLLLHLGFKWDASDNAIHVMTRYTCFPSFSVEDMLERLSNVFYGHKFKSPFEITKGVISLASSRVDFDDFLYFEANEEDNPRTSFDINMYRANLRMEELYPLLSKMCQHYSIPSEQFHILYEPVRTQIFGHITGGIDREGRDFLTVYYGEKGSTR